MIWWGSHIKIIWHNEDTLFISWIHFFTFFLGHMQFGGYSINIWWLGFVYLFKEEHIDTEVRADTPLLKCASYLRRCRILILFFLLGLCFCFCIAVMLNIGKLAFMSAGIVTHCFIGSWGEESLCPPFVTYQLCCWKRWRSLFLFLAPLITSYIVVHHKPTPKEEKLAALPELAIWKQFSRALTVWGVAQRYFCKAR